MNIGSKYWMQECVKRHNMTAEIEKSLNAKIKWISPTVDDLHERALGFICKSLGLNKNEIKNVMASMPPTHPIWDGAAIDTKTSILYLFEAKAHSNELKSKCRASKNYEKIVQNMNAVHDKYYRKGDFSLWKTRYYQLANRLTFMHMLNDIKLPGINKVELVLLNFANDSTHIPESKAELKDSLKTVYKSLTGLSTYEKEVKVISINVKDLK